GARAAAPPRPDSARPPAAPVERETGAAPGRGLGNAEEWINAGTEALAPPLAILPAAMRVRLTYAKRGRARFISHLEMIEVIDRACRRAHLPLAFSQGHRPAPKLRFSPGLPVGAESDCELLDIDLTAVVPAIEVAARFGAFLPEGLSVLDARAIDLRAPSPEHGLAGFGYRVDLRDVLAARGADWIDARLAAFEAAASFPLLKRTGHGEKTIDARARVRRLARQGTTLEIEVAFTAAGSLKPTELLGALFELTADAARALPLYKTQAFYQASPAAAAPVAVAAAPL
ncbi:MAG: TIGR03936 family radical SAM-associated protein, partial [Deltaproteobacteria bacterium]|nr:TIGR03936 family radical SAM-associated protein [Deltaproteobacteria bacterium]